VTGILHLSLPVRDLEEARSFYVDTLGCRPGRVRPTWMDVWFWGLQLTLQERPEEVASLADQGSRHFGVSLEPVELGAVLERLRGAGDAVEWLTPVAATTDPLLDGKTSVKLSDPSGNVIELKSYPSWSDLTADGGD
jgi:uncharacterized protein